MLGLIIAFAFNFKQKKTKSFMMTLALLPVIVQVVIMLVNGNIGTGVAVMGAFSLVRFRSVPGSAMDICAIFLSMAVGLATGTNHLALALMLAVCVSLLNIIYTLLPALITLFPRYGLLLDGAIVSAPATDVLSEPLAWIRTRISAP